MKKQSALFNELLLIIIMLTWYKKVWKLFITINVMININTYDKSIGTDI